MDGSSTSSPLSLFDFGPLAREYDRWYETPLGLALDRLEKRDVLSLLGRSGAGRRLLDVGCGTGHWSRFFASLGYSVEGVDLSEEMIAAAKEQRPPGCRFSVADAHALPFEEGSFDLVAAMAALEFIPDPGSALAEMARSTRPGGSMLIGTLNRRARLNLDRLQAGQPPYTSARMFAPKELRSLLSPFGKVRMIASSPGSAHPVLLLLRAIGDRIATWRGNLNGPFLVAEVQR